MVVTPSKGSALVNVGVANADVPDAPPVIDISGKRDAVVAQNDAACRTWGVFVCVDHNADAALLGDIIAIGHRFFELPPATKLKYHLREHGTRWRGYMPHGGECSQGGKVEDFKEGRYLGEEHAVTNLRVVAGLPTFGSNVLPDAELPEMRALVQRYTAVARALGDRVMDLLSLALGLDESFI